MKQLLAEFAEAKEKAEGEVEIEKARATVQNSYDFYHKGNGAPAKDKTPVDTKREWKSFGEYLIANYAAGIGGKPDPRLEPKEDILLPEELKQLSGNIGAAGGFLIPQQFIATLLAKAAETAIVRPRATVIPMTSRSVLIPSLDQTALPAGGSAFFGSMVMTWIEESEEKPEVDIDFKQVELTAHECAGWLPVPNSLLADSAVSLEALIPQLFGSCMADEEDYRFLRGTGVGQPTGVLIAPASIFVARAGAGAVVFADIMGILEQFQPGAKGVWIAALSVRQQIYSLVDAAGNYIYIPNMAGSAPEMLMGYPVIYTEKLPVLGTQGDLMLCDFSYYVIGDRDRPAIASSVHERFRHNQTTWRIDERVDGQPWLSAPVPLRDGVTTVSPFVGLTA